MPRRPRPLPAQDPPPPPCGEQAIQVLRTYSRKRPSFPFAPQGERSIARAYEKAFGLARSLIYIEDQYLWSSVVARGIAAALRCSSELRVIAVVPRFPDADGRFTGPTNRIGQIRAINMLWAVAPDRVGIFDIENAAGTPIYVHAKVCVVDDVWFTCGSDNFNRRSWTSDSELTCAVVDARRDEREPTVLDGHRAGARVAARELRLQLWAEHLGLSSDDPRLLTGDPLDLWSERAGALDQWHARGSHGPRPEGRARLHQPAAVSPIQHILAAPIYALVADPDGRSWRHRRANTF